VQSNLVGQKGAPENLDDLDKPQTNVSNEKYHFSIKIYSI
jgi:hypothetical protein